MAKPQHRHNNAHAAEGISARTFRRMARTDQHEERTEPTRYRESRTVDPELPRARASDTWPGRA